MTMSMYYVYVLQSESDAGLYIGFSADLKRRLEQHRAANLNPLQIVDPGS
jgi:predicted GIY-YIG superfamily endonuclease